MCNTLVCCVLQEVSEVIDQQRSLMKCVLEDTCLNSLRLEGGTVLARIRKEEACDNANYRYQNNVRVYLPFVTSTRPLGFFVLLLFPNSLIETLYGFIVTLISPKPMLTFLTNNKIHRAYL